MGLIFRKFAGLLAQNEQLLNDLNVFPVPDADTGTNSLLTIQSGLAHIDKGKKDAAAVANHMATAAGQNARGNSGVILAEYLRGFAQSAEPLLFPETLHTCLQSASEFAHNSVANPSDGTMLSVAQAATKVALCESLEDYVRALVKATRAAVHESTSQLPELRVSGVVDAGALGLSLFFDSLYEVISKKQLLPLELAQITCDVHDIEYRGPEFEVMFNFSGDAYSLREELAVLGESLTVTGPAENARFHIHVENATEVILEAMRHGLTSRVEINHLVGAEILIPEATQKTGVVVVIEGPGLISEVSSLGAYCLSADTEVSVSDFEAAIRSTNRTNVILLPSAANNHAAAAIAAHNLRAESINVGVISTRSMPQSLAALAVFDADATHYRNLESMKSAFQSTRTGLVLKTHAGVIEGYIDGELIAASASTIPDDMLVHLVDLLLDEGGELVTVIVGEHGEMIQIQLMADHVGIQFDIINGGQHSSIYLIGVE